MSPLIVDAQTPASSWLYLGASMGNADVNKHGDDTTYRWTLGIPVWPAPWMSFDLPLSLEAHYAALGQPAPSVQAKSYSVDMVVPVELAPRVALLGRLGWAWGHIDLPDASTTKGSGIKTGFGIQYQINKQLALRGELEFYKFDPKIDTMLLGLTLGF